MLCVREVGRRFRVYSHDIPVQPCCGAYTLVRAASASPVWDRIVGLGVYRSCGWDNGAIDMITRGWWYRILLLVKAFIETVNKISFIGCYY